MLGEYLSRVLVPTQADTDGTSGRAVTEVGDARLMLFF